MNLNPKTGIKILLPICIVILILLFAFWPSQFYEVMTVLGVFVLIGGGFAVLTFLSFVVEGVLRRILHRNKK